MLRSAWRLRLMTALGCAALTCACSPELRGTACSAQRDCATGEICVASRCVRDLDAVGSDADAPDDTDGDGPDGPGLDGGDGPEDPVADAPSDGDTSADPDLADEPDLPLTCSDDDLAFVSSRAVWPFEPCLPPVAEAAACVWPGPSQEARQSSRPREREVVDLPLLNGRVDSDVLALFRFDENLDNEPPSLAAAVTSDEAYSAGRFGDDAAFDLGPGASLEVAVPDLDRATDFTLMLWVELGDDSSATSPLLWAGGAETYLELQIRPAGWTLAMNASGTPTFRGTAATPAPSAGWHHVALVHRGDGPLWVFVDAVNLVWDASPSPTEVVLPGVVRLGGPGPAGDETPLTASADELVIARRALSPAELRQYVVSERPYGWSLVPGAQADYDDVRFLDVTGATPAALPAERVGVAPFSTSAAVQPLHYYPLDLALGTDLGTGAENGTPVGLIRALGRFGDATNAALFAGSAYFTSAWAPTLDSGDSFAIELWARIEVAGGTLFGLAQGDDAVIELAIGNEGRNLSGTVLDTAGLTTVEYDGTVSLDSWHHLAFVREPNPLADGQHLVLFLDGLPVATAPVDGEGLLDAGGTPLAFGASDVDGVPIPNLNGTLDEILIWEGAVPSASAFYHRVWPAMPSLRVEVTTAELSVGPTPYRDYRLAWGNALAAWQPPVFDSRRPGCLGAVAECNGWIGWWRFQEGGGTILADESTAAHHLPFALDEAKHPLWEQGALGYGLRFDATGRFATGLFTAPETLEWAATNLAIEAFTTLDTPDSGKVFSWVSADGDPCSLVELSFDDGRLWLRLSDDDCALDNTLIASAAYVSSTPFHVAAAHRFGDSGPFNTFYVDYQGVETDAWTGVESAVPPSADLHILRLGVSVDAYGGRLEGFRLRRPSSPLVPPQQFMQFPETAFTVDADVGPVFCLPR